MLYHKKERIYCLSVEDRNELIRKGKYLTYDKEVDNYFWILETVNQTKPNFFEIKQEDWLKVICLGYSGSNDVREIIEWFEFEYKLSYTRHHYQGAMISGSNSYLLESYIILDNITLSQFISVTVRNIDERSKYVLMKEVVSIMLMFFQVKKGKVFGPERSNFEKHMRGEAEWT